MSCTHLDACFTKLPPLESTRGMNRAAVTYVRDAVRLTNLVLAMPLRPKGCCFPFNSKTVEAQREKTLVSAGQVGQDPIQGLRTPEPAPTCPDLCAFGVRAACRAKRGPAPALCAEAIPQAELSPPLPPLSRGSPRRWLPCPAGPRSTWRHGCCGCHPSTWRGLSPEGSR